MDLDGDGRIGFRELVIFVGHQFFAACSAVPGRDAGIRIWGLGCTAERAQPRGRSPDGGPTLHLHIYPHTFTGTIDNQWSLKAALGQDCPPIFHT